MSTNFRRLIWHFGILPIIRSYNILYDFFAFSSLKSDKQILLISSAGLGDHLLLADLYIEISKIFKLSMLVEEKHLSILKVLVGDSEIKFLTKSSSPSNKNYFQMRGWERQQARKLGLKRIYFSTDAFNILNFLRPDYPPLAHCFRLFGVNFEFYLNGRARLNFRKESSNDISIPDLPYVVTDSFVGTDREIPAVVLGDIRSRGYKIINNPQNLTYLEMVGLLESATELHLTNSSLLCLSLLLDVKSQSNNLYLKREGLLHSHEFAPSYWNEFALRDFSGNAYTPPKKINRDKLLLDLRQKKINRLKRFVYEKLMTCITKNSF